ncbi:FG-GAP repeat protein [Halorhabdus salina]|uniref:FG-GAP repeat protein n=1 Tax=Halorhabdus salina TaxID=2750670 RepID=UPI0015EFD15D|nr:FG-GAP repeat protein [Halorhabdus salina]
MIGNISLGGKATRREMLTLVNSTTLVALAGCVFSEPTETEDAQNSVAKLLAKDGNTNDRFGFWIDMSNDGQNLLVGSYQDSNPNGENAGGVYVFKRDQDGWYQSAKLLADDGDRYDFLGSAVSISDTGETALIGAIAEEDPNGPEGGAAYVYQKEGQKWHQQSKLSAPDGEEFDQFSRSLLLTPNGDTAYVGAPFRENSNRNSTGAVFEYSRESDGWKLVNSLPKDGISIESFGYAMDISRDGETLVVSRMVVSDSEKGAAYVFKQSNDEWVRQATLTASEGDPNDYFGETVTVSEDGQTVLVGASNDEDPNGEQSGSVYLFENRDSEWHQTQKLTPADPGQRERFGLSLAMTSNPEAILIGAPGESSDTGEQSRICVFKQDNDHWQQDRVIPAPENDPTDYFGTRITVSRDAGIAAVSAPEADGNEESTGAVYVFDLAETIPLES